MSRTALKRTLVTLALVTAVLGIAVLAQDTPEVESTAPGDVVALGGGVYGLQTTVRVPLSDLDLRVGAPVSSIPFNEVDGEVRLAAYEDDVPPDELSAPEGGRLVPMSWRARPRGSFGELAEPPVTTIRLVAGEQEVEVWTGEIRADSADRSIFGLQSAMVAVDGELDLTDLAVEVDFDGQVQTLDAATGEIDAGIARALYERRSFSTGCETVPDDCDFVAASPDQPLRPYRHGFIASGGSLYPYDSELGWAEDGTLWAATRVQVFGGVAMDAAGTTWFAPDTQRTRAEIDGAEAVVNPVAEGFQSGRLVFAVPADADPELLVLTQDARLEDTDRTMQVRAEVPLG